MNYRGLPFAFGTKLTWQWLLLTGKQRFCVTAFLKVASGKFPWIRKKEQKNYSWHFPRYVLLNPKRLNQSRQSEMYQTVEIRCCLRAVFVFGAKSHATLGWTQRALSIQPKHWKIRKQGQIVEKFPGNVSRNFGSCWISEMRIIYQPKILEILGATKKLNEKKTSGKKFPNIWVHPARLSYF